jgi:hypothetical protein
MKDHPERGGGAGQAPAVEQTKQSRASLEGPPLLSNLSFREAMTAASASQ